MKSPTSMKISSFADVERAYKLLREDIFASVKNQDTKTEDAINNGGLIIVSAQLFSGNATKTFTGLSADYIYKLVFSFKPSSCGTNESLGLQLNGCTTPATYRNAIQGTYHYFNWYQDIGGTENAPYFKINGCGKDSDFVRDDARIVGEVIIANAGLTAGPICMVGHLTEYFQDVADYRAFQNVSGYFEGTEVLNKIEFGLFKTSGAGVLTGKATLYRYG